MKYNWTKEIGLNQVRNLYEDADWKAYTNDLNGLMKGIENSLDVLSLWDEDLLIGLIRTVGDGQTIIYIQDILILSTYQRKGYGKRLLDEILKKYDHVRMKVLLTDDTEKTNAFYHSVGFVKASEVNTVCYLNHKNP